MKLDTKDKWIIAGISAATLLVVSFIFRRSIMDGTTKFVSNIKNLAVRELNFWKLGMLKEGDLATMDKLRAYWKEGAGVTNWNDKQMTDEAWSAAFISYIMKKSGAGDDWKYSPSHSTYITASIKNRKENNKNPFKGYKPEEVKLAEGDLVGKLRQTGVTYDTTGTYLSHTDVVTAIKLKEGYAESIGGNVGNSVSMTKIPLTADGHIDNSKVKGDKYFVIVKNKK